MSEPKKKGRRLVILCLIGLVGIGVVLGNSLLGKETNQTKAKEKNKSPQSRVIRVTVEPVVMRPLQRTVNAVGSIYGRDEVVISPKVEGRVIKIHRDVGDIVKPGDLLLELDPTDYQLAINEAKRALDLELVRLGLTELPTGKFEVSRVPGVLRAAALERLAEARRSRALKANNSMAADEKEQMLAEFDVARANYRQAVLEAEATLATARQRQSMIETLQQKLKDTKIVVPTPSPNDPKEGSSLAPAEIEYVVCSRGVVEGEMVHTFQGMDTTLFKLVIDRPLKLMANLPERHRPDIKVDQVAEIEVESYPAEKFVGKVYRINPSVDRQSRTFQVEIRLPNEQRRLSPGSFAKVAIQTKLDPQAKIVPEEAIVNFAGVTKVFVEENGKAREVRIQTGTSLEIPDKDRIRTWIEVEGNLPANAKVITTGHSQLANGVPVQIRIPADSESNTKSQD